jgi:hypothetical protein
MVFTSLTSFYGNGGTKFSEKKAERRLSLSLSSPAGRGNTENRGNLCHHEWTRINSCSVRPEDFEIHFLVVNLILGECRRGGTTRSFLRAAYRALLRSAAKVATERDVEPASPIPADLKVEQNTQAILHFGDDFLLSCRENRGILNPKLD